VTGHPWTLRRRLVLSVVALLAVVGVVIGVVSVLALREALTTRVDEQLAGVIDRSGGPGRPSPDEDSTGGPGRGSIPPAFLSVGTISIVESVGVVGDAYYFDDGGLLQLLSKAQVEELVDIPADGEPHTVALDGLGDYRAIAVEGTGSTRITALPLSQVQSIVLQLILVIGIITLAGLLLAAAAATLIVRYALRPLDRVAATATEVSGLPLDRGEVALAVRVADSDADDRTEVGKVGAAINRMLGHVGSALAARQASEQKVRQFVADASHELRTPLASIRGYAELTRRSNHDLPPDVIHAIGRVESEAKRMTSLVEDLLLLARLDEGRDLEQGEVDLSRLLINAVGDAHAAGPEHRWSLDLPEEPVVVPGDELRLHQVIANLLANARTHTPPGTTVTVELGSEGSASSGTAVISVIDDGPGISESSQEQLFERFVRGDSSRSRIAGSTGLGLAIVKAVVAGHRGSVGVESRPGRTVFRVALPRG